MWPLQLPTMHTLPVISDSFSGHNQGCRHDRGTYGLCNGNENDSWGAYGYRHPEGRWATDAHKDSVMITLSKVVHESNASPILVKHTVHVFLIRWGSRREFRAPLVRLIMRNISMRLNLLLRTSTTHVLRMRIVKTLTLVL